MGRELKKMGCRRLSARLRHRGQKDGEIETYRELPRQAGSDPQSPPARIRDRDLVARRGRVGQKTGYTRRWARRGSRPSAAVDQRTQSAWICGAVCPAKGKGAGLVMPRFNIEAMQAHLREISQAVAEGGMLSLLWTRPAVIQLISCRSRTI